MKKKVKLANLRDEYRKLKELINTGENYYIGVIEDRKLLVISEKEFNLKKNKKGYSTLERFIILFSKSGFGEDKYRNFDIFCETVNYEYMQCIYNSNISRYTLSEYFYKILMKEKKSFENKVIKVLKTSKLSKDACGMLLNKITFEYSDMQIHIDAVFIDIRIPIALPEYDSTGRKLGDVNEKRYFKGLYRYNAPIKFTESPSDLSNITDSYELALLRLKIEDISIKSYGKITSNILEELNSLREGSDI